MSENDEVEGNTPLTLPVFSRRRQLFLVTGIHGVLAIMGALAIPQIAHAAQVNEYRETTAKLESLQTDLADEQAKLDAATALSNLQYTEASKLVAQVDSLGETAASVLPKKETDALNAAVKSAHDTLGAVPEDSEAQNIAFQPETPDPEETVDDQEVNGDAVDASQNQVEDLQSQLVAVLSDHVETQTAAQLAQQATEAEAAAQAAGNDGYVDPATGNWVSTNGETGDDNSRGSKAATNPEVTTQEATTQEAMTQEAMTRAPTARTLKLNLEISRGRLTGSRPQRKARGLRFWESLPAGSIARLRIGFLEAQNYIRKHGIFAKPSALSCQGAPALST